MPTVTMTREYAIDRKALFDEPGHRVTLPFHRRIAAARHRRHHGQDARVPSIRSRRP